jgi:hypothetical protein
MRISKSSESGFSFIDVMIAMTILLVGLLSLTGALAAALVRVRESESQFRSKMFTLSIVEAAFTARDIPVTTTAGTAGGSAFFQNQVKNVADGGIFVDGRNPVYELPGPDGVYGTADDDGPVVNGVEREIIISDIPDPSRPSDPISLKQISVTVFYKVGSAQRVESAVIEIADVQRQSNT